VQSVLAHTRPLAIQHFLQPPRQAKAMVTSRAKAAPEEVPTTVSTSSTTLAIILEAAEAPASMRERKLVGDSAGTAGKGQAREPTACTCPWGWRVRAQR
jgi:hypothetical protein